MVAFPDYAPAELQLKLPNYPVLLNQWRAQETPEILGDLPVGAELTLRYRNIPDSEVLQFLQVWRATGGGMALLDALPASIAAGILDPDLANRILDPGSVGWAMVEQPKQSSAKAGRSNVDVKLITELRVDAAQLFKPVDCAVYTERSLDDSCTYVPPNPPPDPVSGNWFRYADGVNDGRSFGVGGFADTDNNIYGIGTDEQNSIYRYVARVDLNNATPVWNKRISFSDSGSYSLGAVPQGSLVDDENGTDGTLSLFVKKNGASFTRIYRVVISKTDGSIVNTIVSELNIDPSSNFNCVVRKVNSNYIVNFLPAQVPNPCGGRNLALTSLVASFTPDMQINWTKVFGRGSKENYGGGTIFASIFPKFDNGSAPNAPYYFFGFDASCMYIPNGHEGGSYQHGNNYIKLDINTGDVIGGPTVWQTDPALSTTNAIHSRSAYAGSDGSIYTDGFTAGSVVGASYLVKWDNDTPTWSRSYNFGGISQTTTGQKLLERNGKILLANQIQYSTGFYDLRICLVDSSDGSVIANTGKLIYWDGGVTKDIGGTNINVVPMANPSGAVIITQTGWFVRIDVDNMPAAGIYPMSDVPGSNWLVDDITVTSSAFSMFTSPVTSESIGCSFFRVGADPMPTLTNVSVTGTNPSVTATAENHTDALVARVGGYYASS